MPAGVELFNSVLNQLGSPALYSDVFANRPAFGFTGRLFISTDTNEIYRDTGTSWVLISSGGGGVNIYNSNGSLTAARTVTMANHPLTFEGGANVNRIIMSADNNVARIFSFRTAGTQRWAFRVDGNETGSNAGADWALRAYNDAGTFIFSPLSIRRRTGEIETFAEESITTAGASIIGLYTNSTGTYAGGLTTTGGNPQTSNFNIYTLASAGNVTFANSNLVGTTVNVIRAQVNNAGTVTFPASGTGGLRAATNFVSQLQYNTAAAAATYTRMANVHLQGVYEVSGGNTFTITNAHQLLINALNENAYTGAQLTITNRWGIYQDGATDGNYFAGVMQLGSTTSTGEQLQVTGTARVTQSAFIGTSSGGLVVGDTTLTAGTVLDVVGQNSAVPFLFGGNRIFLMGMKIYNANTTKSVVFILGEDRGTSATPFYIERYGSTHATTANRVDIVNAQNAPVTIWTNTTERMRITSGGDVGIGTATPASYGGAKFAVYSSSGTTLIGVASADTAGGAGLYLEGSSSVNNFAQLRQYSASTAGTIAGVNIAGAFAMFTSPTSTGPMLIVQQGAQPIVFGTNNTERLRITSGGNVLIGTTTDGGSKLQVVGNGASFGDGTNTFSIYFNTARAWEFKATGTGAGTALRLADTTGGKDFIIEDATSTNVSARFSNGTVVVSESNSGNFRIGSQSAGTGANLVYVQRTGTAPSTSPADCFQLYSADITAGNAAAHFRTEGGAVIKVYQETTGVAAATLVGGGGTNITDTDTFGGYTLQQVVQALRNQGLLA
jgi:hypothetical protein